MGKKVPIFEIKGDNVALYIVKAIHRKNPLSIVTETNARFCNVFGTFRGENEGMKWFESRFDADVSGYNVLAPSAKFP